MCHRLNFILVRNLCEAVLISFFSAPKRLNKLPEERFKFPLNPDCQIYNIGFFNRPNHGGYSHPGAQVGTKNKNFGTGQNELNQEFISVCDVG